MRGRGKREIQLQNNSAITKMVMELALSGSLPKRAYIYILVVHGMMEERCTGKWQHWRREEKKTNVMYKCHKKFF